MGIVHCVKILYLQTAFHIKTTLSHSFHSCKVLSTRLCVCSFSLIGQEYLYLQNISLCLLCIFTPCCPVLVLKRLKL
uniref:Uncharacterized protein n=1 Tax=Anguilla anguilla TaxID=7936 RepID=A0A0E9XJ60_ANGAN